MKKNPLICVNICTMVILVLCSLTNVVGYQTTQSSTQNSFTNEINPKNLLFQTIFDLTNNIEIQRIILKSQMNRGIFPNPDSQFIISKNQLKQMYLFGSILSKTFNKSRLYSIVKQYQLMNKGEQKDIAIAIKKNATLNKEIKQLLNFKCDCENNNSTRWSFPVLCIILLPLFAISAGFLILGISEIPIDIMMIFGFILNCFWYQETVP